MLVFAAVAGLSFYTKKRPRRGKMNR
jgi:hypothetical protein